MSRLLEAAAFFDQYPRSLRVRSSSCWTPNSLSVPSLGLSGLISDQFRSMDTKVVDQYVYSLLGRHLLPQTDEKVLEAVLIERLGPDLHMS